MTGDELDQAMGTVEAHWRAQSMTLPEITTWRRMLKSHDLEVVTTTLDALARDFPRFRPDTGVVLQAVQAAARRRAQATATPEIDTEPATPPERAKTHLASLRQQLAQPRKGPA